MNITLNLNGDPIKYAKCRFFSNSALTTPIILSNGNGTGSNTITANVNGIVSLTASNCQSTVYCLVESDPLNNYSSNFRLKTGAITSISPSAAAITKNLSFINNIYIPAATKCAIGYDLLTLGYRYDISKRFPRNSTQLTYAKASTLEEYYNKAFSFAEINSLDKTAYNSTVTQTSFSFTTSSISTSARNTTRNVNLPIPKATVYATQTDALVEIGTHITEIGEITNELNFNSSIAFKANCVEISENSHNYAVNIPICYFNFGNSPICGLIKDETSIILNTDNLEINCSGTVTSGIITGTTERIKVYFYLILIDTDGITYSDSELILLEHKTAKQISSGSFNYNIACPNILNVGSGDNDFNSTIFGNRKYALIASIQGVPSDFTSFSIKILNDNNAFLSNAFSIEYETPGKIVLFGNDNTGVSKTPKVPVYMVLEKSANSYYNNYSLYINNPADAHIHTYNIVASGASDKWVSELKWVNSNPANIGTTTVSYNNLYGYLCAYGRESGGSRSIWNYFCIHTPSSQLYNYTSIAPKNLTKNVSAKSITAYPYGNNYTATNIFRSINEQLAGRHMLLYAYTKINV